jgi:hypothetical protein
MANFLAIAGLPVAHRLAPTELDHAKVRAACRAFHKRPPAVAACFEPTGAVLFARFSAPMRYGKRRSNP